jgi:hypothetical protein
MKTRFKINCSTCLKSPYCTELCDRAKEYSEQDHVPLREKVLGKPVVYATWGAFDRHVIEPGVILNDKQLCVMVLLSAGVPKEVVMKAMRINGMNMNRMIQVIKGKYESIEEEKKNS